ncbi:MAG TPA: hypothetical protein VGH45_11615 [Solirubrobacteraceae bacterium]|jgi:hypothetical protein
MDPDQQLLHETRVRNRQAVVAILGGLLLVVAAAIQLGGPHTKVDELTLDLITANKRFPLDLIASVINAIASLLIAWTLTYLYSCARARSADVKPFVKIVTIVGGVLAAITGVAYAIVVAIKVHQFATTGSQTYEEANHLTSGSGLLALQLLGQAAALLLAVAFVLVSLNAMRVGLLSRFMGYLGIFAGVLVLFQIVQIPVVQGYWLAALGYLFSGRWPSGVPPAWRSGRAEPWPSSAEMRARRAAGAGAGGGGGGGGGGGALGGLLGGRRGPAPKPRAQPAGGPGPAPAANGRTRSTTPKRKRKRRN